MRCGVCTPVCCVFNIGFHWHHIRYVYYICNLLQCCLSGIIPSATVLPAWVLSYRSSWIVSTRERCYPERWTCWNLSAVENAEKLSEIVFIYLFVFDITSVIRATFVCLSAVLFILVLFMNSWTASFLQLQCTIVSSLWIELQSCNRERWTHWSWSAVENTEVA